jgi:hypothetical protein
MISQTINPPKDKYKVRNWQVYNKSLCNRGKITLFLTPRVIQIWRTINLKKVTIGEKMYPDFIIEICLTLAKMYSLPLRQTTGFVRDLLDQLGLEECPVPDYSTLSRRQKYLDIDISTPFKSTKNLAIAVDSTGLKVYGEGEWKVKKHGAGKHRTWLKLHLAVDVQTQEIVKAHLTSNAIHDAKAAIDMFSDTVEKENISSFYGDGAYDDFKLREFLSLSTKQIIPPPKNAVVKKAEQKKPIPNYLFQRNQAIERRKEIGSKDWKKEINYHQRSLSETAMYRYKMIFGDKVEARTEENQKTEVFIKCKILNRFRQEGMPNSYKVEYSQTQTSNFCKFEKN